MGGENRNRRILWVTCDFPQRQSSGMFRPVRTYKYLEKTNLEVHFLTQSIPRRVQSAMVKTKVMTEVQPKPTVFKAPNYKVDELMPWMAAADR